MEKKRKCQVYNYTEKRQQSFTIINPYTGNFGEAFENFLLYYEPQVIVLAPSKKPVLGKKSERMCRFCIKAYPEVKFRMDAHVLPELMGNRLLTHDCECDNCNVLFGRYEDSLSKFVGMLRTADAIKGKEGIPTYKSGDGKMVLRYEKDPDGKQYISIYDGRENIPGVSNDRTITLTATKQPYIPLTVMKCFWKIGYSILPAEELQNFHSQRKIITSNMFDDKLKNFASIVKFTMPEFLETPMAFLWRKKSEHKNEHMPSKVMKVYFGRWMYEYFLIDQRDSFLFKDGQQCTFIHCPPMSTADPKDIFSERIDLSSTERKVGEVESMIFTFDPKP